jgi:hypothetical protein
MLQQQLEELILLQQALKLGCKIVYEMDHSREVLLKGKDQYS